MWEETTDGCKVELGERNVCVKVCSHQYQAPQQLWQGDTVAAVSQETLVLKHLLQYDLYIIKLSENAASQYVQDGQECFHIIKISLWRMKKRLETFFF